PTGSDARVDASTIGEPGRECPKPPHAVHFGGPSRPDPRGEASTSAHGDERGGRHSAPGATAMPHTWQYLVTRVVLSERAAVGVRARGSTKPGSGGGRRLRVRVRRAGGAGARRAPIGVLFLRWRGDAGPVTIYHVGWDPDAGGSAEELLRAAAQLAGTLQPYDA